MYQKFSKDLSTQEIYASGIELSTKMGLDRDAEGRKVYSYPETKRELVAILKDPVLVTDPYAVIAQIKDYPAQITTDNLINKGAKTTEYDGTALYFDQNEYKSLRGPNRDTLFFCKGMNDVDLTETKDIIEICAGTGFIGRHIQNRLEKMGISDYSLMYNDINEQAKEYYNAYNDTFIDKNYHGGVGFMLGDAREILELFSYDLVMCNPPYIPRRKSIEDNAYEGLELLQYLLTNPDKFLNKKGKLVVNVSSLGNEVILPLLKELEEKGWEVTGKGTMEVPLKVFNVLNNKERFAEILANPGLIQKLDHAHPYRHQLALFEISRKTFHEGENIIF